LVAPHTLIEHLLAVRRVTGPNLPILEQLALADFTQEGHFARHLSRMRGHYRQRRDILVRELVTNLGELLDVHAPEAGMQLLTRPPRGVDDRQTTELAAAAGIFVLPVTTFCREPTLRNGFIFGFAWSNEETLHQGVHTLDTAFAQR
jgi:GntR family transcriptional regulator / MocR family aminotransferase